MIRYVRVYKHMKTTKTFLTCAMSFIDSSTLPCSPNNSTCFIQSLIYQNFLSCISEIDLLIIFIFSFGTTCSDNGSSSSGPCVSNNRCCPYYIYFFKKNENQRMSACVSNNGTIKKCSSSFVKHTPPQSKLNSLFEFGDHNHQSIFSIQHTIYVHNQVLYQTNKLFKKNTNNKKKKIKKKNKLNKK